MKLTPHFTLEEMTTTQYPALQSKPALETIVHLCYLCAVILEPLREAIGKPVKINSGYRGRELNKAVGGVWNSYHLTGRAADIHCDTLADARLILAVLKDNPHVDLAMVERKYSTWVHVQWSESPRHIIRNS